MNKLHILAMAAIVMAIAPNAIEEVDKRPSVDDINKQIGDKSYKVTAKDADAAFKGLNANAQAHADLGSELEKATQAVGELADEAENHKNEIERLQAGIKAEHEKLEKMEAYCEELDEAYQAALIQVKESGVVSLDEVKASEGETKVKLKLNVRHLGKRLDANTEVTLPDSVIADLSDDAYELIDS